jgi:hypothetical protein
MTPREMFDRLVTIATLANASNDTNQGADEGTPISDTEGTPTNE